MVLCVCLFLPVEIWVKSTSYFFFPYVLVFLLFFFLLLPFPFGKKTTYRTFWKKTEHWMGYFFTFIKGSVTGHNICALRNPHRFWINTYKPLDWSKTVFLGVLPLTFFLFQRWKGKEKELQGNRMQLEKSVGDWSVVSKITQLL